MLGEASDTTDIIAVLGIVYHRSYNCFSNAL